MMHAAIIIAQFLIAALAVVEAVRDVRRFFRHHAPHLVMLTPEDRAVLRTLLVARNNVGEAYVPVASATLYAKLTEKVRT